jgi:hypothetical protein
MEVSSDSLQKEYLIRGKIINSKFDFILLSLSISAGLILFLIILYSVVKIYNFEWNKDHQNNKEEVNDSLDDIEGLEDVEREIITNKKVEVVTDKEVEDVSNDKEVEDVSNDKEVEDVSNDKEVEDVSNDKEVEDPK